MDAYPIVALAADEEGADEVEQLLRDSEGQVGVLSVNLAEAIDVLARLHGIAVDDSRDALTPLLGNGLRVLPVLEAAAWRAAAIRSTYYARKTRAVSIADCLLIAAAEAEHHIATADSALAAVARDLGVGVVALNDRQGKKP